MKARSRESGGSVRSDRWVRCFVAAALLGAVAAAAGAAEIPDELRIKTEPVYEFTEKPAVTREGDKVTVRFVSKGFCDATVAIEDTEGKIVRHLASGVLGSNAPEPFAKNAKAQTVVWDGKNDKGEYVDDKNAITVRVSLGLKPRYEKSLYWEPKKRVSVGGAGSGWTEDVIPVPTPEGVYVFDGNGVDHVRLFDHDGNYVRTIYPFPADKLKDVKGLKWQAYPQGYSRPQKNGLNQTTFFTSALGCTRKEFAQPAAFAMAAHGDRIALVKLCLSRLKTDGTTGGLNLSGPRTWFDMRKGKAWDSNLSNDTRCCPYSAAFSPDGKRLYLAGFSHYGQWGGTGRGTKTWLGGVACLDYDGDAPARIFTGAMDMDSGLTPGVACDSQGRVYVTDFIRNAVDVFDGEGKLLKTVPVTRPVFVCVAPKTGELYVFSWNLNGMIWASHPGLKGQSDKVPATLTVIKSVDDPKPVATHDLPWVIRQGGDAGWGDPTCGSDVRAAVDFWTDPPTIWLVPGGASASRGYGEGGQMDFNFRNAWDRSNILLLQARDGKLQVKDDFGKDIAKSVQRHSSNRGHQRLYVNPANRKLYVSENEHWVGGGSFHNLIEIDPDTGKVRIVAIPVQWAEDMTFDIDGRVYLRQVEPAHRVLRFDFASWREIPWDYGEEGRDKNLKIESGLPLPAMGSGCYSEGGLYVSPKGRLAVACSTGRMGAALTQAAEWGAVKNPVMDSGAKPYQPPVYPGRNFVGLNGGCVHVWDSHGKVVIEDTAPGMSGIDGLGIDRDDNIYLMSQTPRVYDGKKYFNFISGTLVKVRPGRNKWLVKDGGPVPLPEGDRPKRSPDISGYTMGDTWIEGADWFYGGVGNCSFKIAPGCICWQQSRMTLDYFARSFAPETDQFSVAALDSNGNLILRIGQYGNADDGIPNAEVGTRNAEGKTPDGPMLAPPSPRSIGGDEVALMQPSHVAAMTDRYLYIGDVGNGRIVQVKLGYHAEEKVALRDVKEKQP
jgi:DNA-binding beta-propeller fold protein YncE